MMKQHPSQTLREALGLSQVAFAAEIGSSQPTVSQVEAGVYGYGKPTILAIVERWRPQCIELGITVESLMRGIEGGEDEVAAR